MDWKAWMSMIIFLDFDGVLHPEPCREEQFFCHLPKLEALLREFPAVRIVISSSWRNDRTLAELRAFFSPDIAAKIIGCTPHHRDLPDLVEMIGITYTRQAEIEGWMRTFGPWEKWVALDDRAYWFRPFCANLIKCDAKTGITDDVLLELRARISR
jgi:hypothetical protein